MGRKAQELSATEVDTLTTPGHHAVGGVECLYLYVTNTGARSWVLRKMIRGLRREMGLGGYPEVTLSGAREKAKAARKDVAKGLDPIEERKALRNSLRTRHDSQNNFEQAATAYIEAHSDGWKNPKHCAQWTATLKTYAYPHIGGLMVQHITQEHILQILEPIWETKTETAHRLRRQIEKILDWTVAQKFHSGENPARLKGPLDKLLPAPGKIQKVEQHQALPAAEMIEFMKALRGQEGLAARALEFAILCASRSGEVRGATWDEIDFESAIWTIPAKRMKADKEHCVPLSDYAVAILKKLPKKVDVDLVFSTAGGRTFSDKALTAVLRRMKIDAVPHGFLSTFHEWAGEPTNHPRDIAEHALAHVIDNKLETADWRIDALKKRREMMQKWADFCKSSVDNRNSLIKSAFQDTRGKF